MPLPLAQFQTRAMGGLHAGQCAPVSVPRQVSIMVLIYIVKDLAEAFVDATFASAKRGHCRRPYQPWQGDVNRRYRLW
jgi:hypothetical protein